ncbi:efflux RND transporter permease subunit [Pigmentibacter sp. JX0631]|uniref:efflux RND transporter permease subunit n=1 Tax=Pigmentibacter sp. JX0631 TaxID=2976982 RepID=UPI0024687475|nr:efflux RND transporter permease subunit [Pigmentibacter sp. JX0631]WGL60441.1 efflux RND transporter permease subunit [Pigmentibacter sp. JX0631]
MHSLSSPFINRPIATSLIALLIILVGILAFNLLPVSQLPQIEFPTISVQANLPGASPDVMATSVATPLEHYIGKISGITEMTSSSSLGKTNIVIQFDLNRDINAAANEVQAAIDQALPSLPAEMPNRPTYRKVNPADAPIMILALTSTEHTKGQMYDIATNILQQKISQAKGVGQVIVGGSSLPSVRIEANPFLLNNYGLTIDDIKNTIQNSNQNSPKGQLSNLFHTYYIATNDQLHYSEQYKPLIISINNGSVITLKDVAEVKDSVEDIKNTGLADNKPAVLLIIFKEPGVNVIETVDGIKGLIPQLSAYISADMQLTVMMDRTSTIRASLIDIEKTLLISIALVICVVFLFLKNIYTTIIPSIVVPISILGTFAVMYLLNFSLDNLSIMALTISTGFVVDDAIVVIENITRYLEKGFSPLKASLIGAKEVGFTVLSMSVSLIAVFIPILLMGGIVGRLFREFAVTLSIAILVSLLVSLTITPSMCSKILKPDKERKQEKNVANSYYAASLQWAIKHSKFMLTVLICIVILNIYFYIKIPKGFFPQQDTGRIMGFALTDQNTSFKNMEKKFGEVIEVLKSDENIEHVVGYVGGGSVNSGNIFISLKSQSNRKLTADEVIGVLRKKLIKIPGISVFLLAAQDIMIGGRQGGAQFQYSISAANIKELNKWGDYLIQELSKIPIIADVNSDQKDKGIETYISIEHETAKKIGISPLLIDNALYDSLGQRQISVIYKDLNQYHVVLETDPKFTNSPNFLNVLYLKNNNKQIVPLNAAASFETKKAILSISHQSQFPSITLSFNLIPGTALGEAVNKVSDKVSELNLPSNLSASFQGTAKVFQATLANQPTLILAAILTVYIVLGILYENLIHPITIISTLPSAGLGALLALYFTKTDLSLIAFVGIILLIGIVKKNAIMMIDFAITLQKNQNYPADKAIFEAAILRLRPIMMTSFAALLGAVPLAFDHGVGSEYRKPLGISIIGGLLISQLLTLYTTPIVFLYFEKIASWLRGKKLKGKVYEAKSNY